MRKSSLKTLYLNATELRNAVEEFIKSRYNSSVPAYAKMLLVNKPGTREDINIYLDDNHHEILLKWNEEEK